jgi:aerobic-type carbon monoxide dehydrogenase small subunit (CoxS/CutS family)
VIRFLLNNKLIYTELPPAMLLLDFVRYHEHLKGTKIGCREGDCGNDTCTGYGQGLSRRGCQGDIVPAGGGRRRGDRPGGDE